MKKVTIIFISGLFLAVLIFAFFIRNNFKIDTSSSENQIVRLQKSENSNSVVEKTALVTIDTKSFTVEVVDTPEKLKRGLSGRTNLQEDKGMIFMIDPPQPAVFWMIDMNFPLDIIWISDGKIVHISKDVPFPEADTPDYQLPKYSANQDVDLVLEINAGLSDKYGFKVGNEVLVDYH